MSPYTLDLTGRRALVTGGGRGLGRAIALALAEAGADLILTSRSVDELEAVAAEARALGSDVHVAPCDLLDDDAADALVRDVPAFDILINNAGINIPTRLADARTEDIDRVLDINVRAVIILSRAVVRRWLAEDVRGSIVSMSSQMGHIAGPNRVLYCASKHAIEGYSKALAVELAPVGIRVNAVAPTFIETAMTAPFLADPAFRADAVAKIPMGRVGQPEDVAGAVVYLVSDAASLVTGTSLRVDGGYTAQ